MVHDCFDETMKRMIKLLLMSVLLALCLVPGRGLGAMPYVQTYHEWHAQWGRAYVEISETDRVVHGTHARIVVPGRQLNFIAGPWGFSLTCSLTQMLWGLLLALMAGAGWVGRRKKAGGEEDALRW